MDIDEGILDLYFNPFANNWDWINQNYGLTPKRGDQLSAILGKSEDGILKINLLIMVSMLHLLLFDGDLPKW